MGDTANGTWGSRELGKHISEEKERLIKKAVELWTSFDKNQRAGVRFGMFPYAIMHAAELEGYNGRDLAVALCDCAKADGGMRA